MLEIKNVHKSYKDNHVLRGVSFDVLDNEIKALIGINGAGKTTLVEIICGIKKIDNGYIKLNNIDIFDKSKTKQLKYTFGYMPQSFCFFSDLTVQENLSYACAVYKLDESRVWEVSKLCGIDDKLNVLAKNLSGGYRQLLSMALAIIHKPVFLILDEPTTAMDPLFRRKFWDIVKKYKATGGTVLVITHYVEELLECDSFVCLSDGIIKIDEKVETYKKESFVDIENILRNCQENKQ